MLVKKLKLNNYRNYQKAYFDFGENINIIIGKNGIGKTNILESLILLSNTKSFRTLNDLDLLKKNEEYAKVECISDEGNFKLVLSKQGKHLYFNDLPILKTSEYIGKLNCILFKPSDLDLFNHSPKERRRLLDLEIGKINKNYLNALLNYSKLLKDRNKLLKEEKPDLLYLDLLDEKMLPLMTTIIDERQNFIAYINKYLTPIFQKISNSQHKIEIIYQKCSDIENLKENQNKNRDKDLYYHYTSFGIHHEDYNFMMDEYLLDSIASQGQIRMVLISFKLALVYYIKTKTNKLPILLLDDILSELDIENRERLLINIPTNTQVIITGTDLMGMKLNDNYHLIEIKE